VATDAAVELTLLLKKQSLLLACELFRAVGEDDNGDESLLMPFSLSAHILHFKAIE